MSSYRFKDENRERSDVAQISMREQHRPVVAGNSVTSWLRTIITAEVYREQIDGNGLSCAAERAVSSGPVMRGIKGVTLRNAAPCCGGVKECLKRGWRVIDRERSTKI